MKITVSNKTVTITDDCSGKCDYSWARITTFGLIEDNGSPPADPTEPEKPETLGMGAIKGGDCDKSDQKTIEFCIFDTINPALAPEGASKCTGKYYFYHIPKNDKVPALEGKFICLSKNYPT